MSRDERDRIDDVDELLGRLEPIEPPDDLVPLVLRKTTRAPARGFPRELAWGLLDAAALVVLALLSVSLGWTLAETGGLDVLRVLAENLELLSDARLELLLAVAEVVPWLHVLALALDLAAVYAISRTLVGELTGPGAASRKGAGQT